ncbi:MAG: PIN domain-containing protein [Cyanobacteria bacterium P01_F01_bin.143]
MKRLVLDSGPLIGLLSKKDQYHQEAKRGFREIPDTFGEVLTPLPILFEVYKFVSRYQSLNSARSLLSIIQTETITVSLSNSDFTTISDLVLTTPNWQGSLEDASVIFTAQQYQAQIWTVDYRDFGFFNNLEFWNPSS